MTTKVTVDAHAGWPVEVTARYGEPDQPKSVSVHIVEAGSAQDFYIHSGLEILNVRELKRQAE
ncbi:hypothetical protein [Sphingopyxis flava]|uniref:Uncharacterized protein n=1 Tax=Sphingopyxis flava TaxID=1507287 RepID=A0A1T5ABH3_9SPHN|nr:hypothetical protein [Sphingopyxis flava]SKB32314.1 hypothetical protein SAMN06295937_100365 [Sphingopyxis flava]